MKGWALLPGYLRPTMTVSQGGKENRIGREAGKVDVKGQQRWRGWSVSALE